MNPYVHGENIRQKIRTEKNVKNLGMLKEIEDKYNEWRNSIEGSVPRHGIHSEGLTRRILHPA